MFTVPECFPEGLCSSVGFIFLRGFFLSARLFFSSTTTGIREGRMFSLGNCGFFSMSSADDELLLLSLLNRVILTGILDFFSTGGRRTLLSLPISLPANHEAIAFDRGEAVFHRRSENLLNYLFCLFVFLFVFCLVYFWYFFFEIDFENLVIFPAPKIGTDRTES